MANKVNQKNAQSISKEVHGIAPYHHSSFEKLSFFASDRKHEIVTGNGTYQYMNPGKKLVDVAGFGLEVETACFSLYKEHGYSANKHGNTEAITDVYGELLTMIFSHFPKDLWRIESDCSLGGGVSAECITQIMSKSFIRNQYPQFKLMWDTYFRAFEIDPSAEKAGCGMHCNMSVSLFGKTKETQDEAIKKFIYIVNTHYKLIGRAVARKKVLTGRVGYAAPMITCKDKSRMMQTTCESLRRNADHCDCFNMVHYNVGRVEFRLVGGQGTYASFRNTMEVIFHLVSRVCTISWADCDDVTKIFKGCNYHVYDRLKDCHRDGCLSAEQLGAIKESAKLDERYL